MSELVIGDVVHLKSSSCDMTVTAISDNVTCTWFGLDGLVRSYIFPVEALKKDSN